jgi:hypothetical protein
MRWIALEPLKSILARVRRRRVRRGLSLLIWVRGWRLLLLPVCLVFGVGGPSVGLSVSGLGRWKGEGVDGIKGTHWRPCWGADIVGWCC